MGGLEAPAAAPARVLALAPRLAPLAAERLGDAVVTCAPHEAPARAAQASVVLASVVTPDELALLRAVLDAAPDVPVIVAADAPFARAALRIGAFAVVPAQPRPADLARALREVVVEGGED